MYLCFLWSVKSTDQRSSNTNRISRFLWSFQGKQSNITVLFRSFLEQAMLLANVDKTVVQHHSADVRPSIQQSLSAYHTHTSLIIWPSLQFLYRAQNNAESILISRIPSTLIELAHYHRTHRTRNANLY